MKNNKLKYEDVATTCSLGSFLFKKKVHVRAENKNFTFPLLPYIEEIEKWAFGIKYKHDFHVRIHVPGLIENPIIKCKNLDEAVELCNAFILKYFTGFNSRQKK